MTQLKHTPEPWEVDYEGPARLAIVHKDTMLAFCNLQNEDGDTDEANARLIAAAPDLLAALETITDNYELMRLNACDSVSNTRIVKFSTRPAPPSPKRRERTSPAPESLRFGHFPALGCIGSRGMGGYTLGHETGLQTLTMGDSP